LVTIFAFSVCAFDRTPSARGCRNKHEEAEHDDHRGTGVVGDPLSHADGDTGCAGHEYAKANETGAPRDQVLTAQVTQAM
jgi:hypothetical protein